MVPIDDTAGISLENVILTKGIIDKDYMVLRDISVPHGIGAPCYLITGRIRNNSSTLYWVAHHSDGYDKNGNEISFTMDTGPIVGVAQVEVPAHSSATFTLHLTWSDNVTSYKLFYQKSEMMFP
jgi:hypothetical protein